MSKPVKEKNQKYKLSSAIGGIVAITEVIAVIACDPGAPPIRIGATIMLTEVLLLPLLYMFVVCPIHQENKDLWHQANIDALTGVFNRRYFEEMMRKEFQRATRTHSKLAVVVIDIDLFKKINDTYGHETGDFALKNIARILKHAIRDYDTLARYGGEEFVVILPGATSDAAKLAGERYRAFIQSRSIRKIDWTVTISCGVASYTPSMTSWEDLFRAADHCLYKAKNKGRNCVVSTDDDATSPFLPGMDEFDSISLMALTTKQKKNNLNRLAIQKG